MDDDEDSAAADGEDDSAAGCRWRRWFSCWLQVEKMAQTAANGGAAETELLSKTELLQQGDDEDSAAVDG